MTASQRDVIEVLTHDHREVERMFAELEALHGIETHEARQRRKDLTDQVTIELVRHSVAEEADVYPAVKKKVSESEAEHAKEEHAEAERTMKRLEGLKPDEPEFEAQLALLMHEIREHVAEEESEMFPHMRSVFTEEELVDLGRKVESTKRSLRRGRTRPPPRTNRRATSCSAPVTGLLDRMRDAVTRRGTER